MTNHDIYPISPKFFAEISALHCQSFHSGWDVKSLEELLASGAEGIIIKKSDTEQIIGFLMWRIAADEAEILTLATAPAHHRKGYGRRLLQEMLHSLENTGVQRIFLEVRNDNVAAEALYRQLGFTPCGHRKDYYLMADGSSRDALIMEHSL